VTSPPPSDSQGFTLTELLIATAISLLTATVAGDLLISHIRSTERAEAMERQRSDWSRTTTFIEAEVALSERVITDASKIAIPTACGFSGNDYRLGLDLRRDLPPVIYAIKPSTTGWLPQNTLWRCGPGLNNDGSYNATLTLAPILDGLDGTAAGAGFIASASDDAKQATFTLGLKGHARVTYS
jgi:prepilin-type N-terminal cleavage/methylation domain-containing protein